MYSSNKSRISNRLKGLLLGGTFDLLSAYFPSEILLEGRRERH
jgi:hypothetical protein